MFIQSLRDTKIVLEGFITGRLYKMSDNGDLINRIDTLETHIVHQDSIIEEQDDLSIKQWVQIQNLNDRFDHLKNEFSELERNIETPPDEDAPPPHY